MGHPDWPKYTHCSIPGMHLSYFTQNKCTKLPPKWSWKDQRYQYMYKTLVGIQHDFRNCHIWAWILAIFAKATEAAHVPSIQWGQNYAYFRSTGSSFRGTGIFTKLPYLGTKFDHWQKFQKLDINSFYTRGPKLGWFSLYRQAFPRYGPIFKIAIFGHETWPLAKVPEVAHILSFYPRGWNWT